MRRVLGCLVLITIAAGACGDDGPAATSPDDVTTTTTTTTTTTSTTSTTTVTSSIPDAEPTPDYEFLVTPSPTQLSASDALGPSAVYPGQRLTFELIAMDETGDPCPQAPEVTVIGDAGVAVAFEVATYVDLPVDVVGPVHVTVQCERDGPDGSETGRGTAGPFDVLALLDVRVEPHLVVAGEDVTFEVTGGCPGGETGTADLVLAEGATLGISTEFGVDGVGRLATSPRLFPQTLYLRVECAAGPDPAVAFTPIDLTSDVTAVGGPVLGSEPIEYQPDGFLSLWGTIDCDDSRPVLLTRNPGMAAEFAERGYLGVSVEPRGPGSTGRFDTETVQAIANAANDFAIAVRWLRANADQYCIETDAIAAGGYSFGGITALALAYSAGDLVAGAVITLDEYGDSVEVPFTPASPPPELAEFSSDIAAAVSFSGFALPDTIEAGETAAILFHGRDDAIVPFALAEKTCEAARAVGVTCELVPHDSGHAMADDVDAAYDLVAEFLAREMLEPAGLPTVR